MTWSQWESPIGFWSQVLFGTFCQWRGHDAYDHEAICRRCGATRYRRYPVPSDRKEAR